MNKYLRYVGDQVGKLTILSITDNVATAQCSCGNTFTRLKHDMRTRKSCGCAKRDPKSRVYKTGPRGPKKRNGASGRKCRMCSIKLPASRYFNCERCVPPETECWTDYYSDRTPPTIAQGVTRFLIDFKPSLWSPLK